MFQPTWDNRFTPAFQRRSLVAPFFTLTENNYMDSIPMKPNIQGTFIKYIYFSLPIHSSLIKIFVIFYEHPL